MASTTFSRTLGFVKKSPFSLLAFSFFFLLSALSFFLFLLLSTLSFQPSASSSYSTLKPKLLPLPPAPHSNPNFFNSLLSFFCGIVYN
jgi:hypothetical protein